MQLIRHTLVASFALIALAASLSREAAAQQPTPLPYGPAINLETAQKILVKAKAEADAQQWPVAIAIVDGGGYLVAFHRLDNTQLGSVEVALQKAKTAALFRRPTKVFEELIEKGGAGLRILSLPQATPIEGGLPIVIDGKIVGAIGVSGVQSTQDAQVATAGLEAVK